MNPAKLGYRKLVKEDLVQGFECHQITNPDSLGGRFLSLVVVDYVKVVNILGKDVSYVFFHHASLPGFACAVPLDEFLDGPPEFRADSDITVYWVKS